MHRVAILSAVAFAFLSANAKAQTSRGSASAGILDVKARVPVGDVVYLTDKDGITVRATLADVSSDVIQVVVDGQSRNVAADQVQRVKWQQRDSPLTGVMIGAGIGAIPGIYFLAADPNECAGMCAEEYALIGIGALVGGLVDWAIKKKVTVYERPDAGSVGRKLSVASMVTPTRKVVQVALRF